MRDAFHDEVRDHDAAVERTGVQIWLGAEPTFTDPRSLAPWWLGDAEGGDKEARARELLLALAPRLGGRARLLRVRGRTYPGEPSPRFCLGALFERHGSPGAAPALAALDGEPAEAPAPGPHECWLTVTPDPGVVEVNSAPAHDLATFARWSDAIYAAAGEVGLSPTRSRYNGDVTDSGGGGQLTVGGPSPERSPFFLQPQLLPRLVRYLNRHPALSYVFAPDCVGGAGQGPRPDEGARERFEELPVAIAWLTRRGDRATPDELWSALAPLLVDLAGNTHRAELNLEKLWNPYLPGRGRMGVVELRALRMPPNPERLIAVAALFRALAARLSIVPYEEPLVDWGGRLHGAFGLPTILRGDLERVLDDLDEHGLGLGPILRAELLAPPEPVAEVALGDAVLAISPALSFWPLLGDVASQEQRSSRCVDSSSARLELRVTTLDGRRTGALSASGWRVPLRRCGTRQELGSITYRAFAPSPGMHPGIPPEDPLILSWTHGGRSVRVTLHGWKPAGGAYEGLPSDEAEARRRRRERVVVSALALPCTGRASASGHFGLDLRQPVGAELLTRPSEAPGEPWGTYDDRDLDDDDLSPLLRLPPVARDLR